MLPIAFALLSYISWGTGDIFATIASRKSDVYTATFWSASISLVFFSIASIFFFDTLSEISWEMFVVSLLIGVVFLAGFLTFTKALIVGNAALVGTIVGSYGVVTVLLSMVFFHESVSFQQGISICLIFLGIVLSTLHHKDLLLRKFTLTTGVFYAVLTMILFGIWGTFIKIPVEAIGWFWPNFIMFLIFPPGIYLLMRMRKAKLQNPLKNNFLLPLVLGALLARIGELSYNLALSKGLIILVAPIASSYPTLFVLLAFFVFKDKITRQQIVGMLLTLIGIICLSVFSS